MFDMAITTASMNSTKMSRISKSVNDFHIVELSLVFLGINRMIVISFD